MDFCLHIRSNIIDLPCCCNVCARFNLLHIPEMYDNVTLNSYNFINEFSIRNMEIDDNELKRIIYEVIKFDEKTKNIKNSFDLKLSLLMLFLEGRLIKPLHCIHVCLSKIKSKSKDSLLFENALNLAKTYIEILD